MNRYIKQVDYTNRYGDKMTRQEPTKWAFIDPLLALLTIFVLFSSIKVVGVGEVGVITRLGNVNREVDSGVTLKMPWPIEKMHTFDIKTQKDEATAAAASQDLQDVNATVVTNYRIEAGKVGELYKTVGTDYKLRLIDPAIQESLKQTTAKYPISELITRRQDVKQEATRFLRERLAPRGILIEDISLTNMEFSNAFTKAIEQKQVAQQEAERAKFNLERARLDAESQNVQKASISAELLQKYAIDKWNGVMPHYVGGGAVFNIPLTK